MHNDPANCVDLWGLEDFSNGKTKDSTTVQLSESGIELFVEIRTNSLDNKIDIGIGNPTDKTPNVKITTTVEFTKQEGESKTKGSEQYVEEPVGPKLLPSMSDLGFNSTPIGQGIKLPDGVTVKDVTKITISLEIEDPVDSAQAVFITEDETKIEKNNN